MAKKRGTGIPKGTANSSRRGIKKARAEIFSELQIKGIPETDIAESYGISPRRVRQIVSWGEKEGIIESVKERMLKQLEKVPNLYAKILDADVTDDMFTAEGVRKARELQLKAARDLAKGYIFKESSVTLRKKETMSLEDFYKLRQARGTHEQPERLSVPELPELSVEGEVE